MIDVNKIATNVANQIIKEENVARRKVVVYSGRFQPMHPGHYNLYKHLVDKFGKENVFIGTSDKVDKPRSPFSFKEKQQIMTKFFGIPKNKVHQIKNPYAPKEILKKFDKDEVAYITVVSKKDKGRLGGSYFDEYEETKDLLPYSDKGYVYVAPMFAGGISASEIRNMLGDPSTPEDVKKREFKRIYGKFDEKIFDLITNTLTESVVMEWIMEREKPLFEIPKEKIKQVDKYADRQLNPIEVDLSSKHFFDRLNDPRNKKDISMAELIGFFKRLKRNKKEFIDFLNKYKQIVVTDNRTKINIPFMKKANRAIAKTIMRKPNFHTSNVKLQFERIKELSYKGNMGFQEMMKFYDMADKRDIDKVERLINKGQDKKAWEIIQKVVGVKLKGKEFHEEFDRYKFYENHLKSILPESFDVVSEGSSIKVNVPAKKNIAEGGAATGGDPIPAECSLEMYKNVTNEVSKKLGIGTDHMRSLGSVGKKPKGQYCGDIDIALGGFAVATKHKLKFDEVQDFIYKKIKPLYDNVVNNKGTGVISFLYPIPNSDNTGQVDIMIVEDVDYADWYYSSPDFTKQESKYKGVYANLLLASIARYVDTKDVDEYFEDEFGGKYKGDVKNFTKYSISPKQGLVKQLKSFMGKTKKLTRAKTVKSADVPITKTPEEIMRFLLGDAFERVDSKSFEDIYSAMKSSKFRFRNKFKDIISDYKKTILNKGLPLPSEID